MSLDGCGKAIARARDVLDVDITVLPISERLAKRHHLYAEVSFVHDSVGPDTREQIRIRHDFARSFDEGLQKGQGARPDPDVPVTVTEQATAGLEAEGAEGVEVFTHAAPYGRVPSFSGAPER
jgi:hypothetical protein